MSNDKTTAIINFFDSIKSLKDVEQLIHDGQEENQHLECKEPTSPNDLSRSLLMEISREISGFSNAGGGTIFFGVETDQKRGLDILTQISPIGSLNAFVKKLNINVPLLTLTRTPVNVDVKTLKKKQSDSKGIVVMYIPGTTGDPIMAKDGTYYLRIGHQTSKMPNEVIKRMFIGSTSPDLTMFFDSKLIKKRDDNRWEIPIVIGNQTSAPAKSVVVSVKFNNFSSCQEIRPSVFRDVSKINPDKKVFMVHLHVPVHKGLNMVVGTLHILMKGRKRMVDITITLYAENMRAKEFHCRVNLLSNSKFKISKMIEEYLY